MNNPINNCLLLKWWQHLLRSSHVVLLLTSLAMPGDHTTTQSSTVSHTRREPLACHCARKGYYPPPGMNFRTHAARLGTLTRGWRFCATLQKLLAEVDAKKWCWGPGFSVACQAHLPLFEIGGRPNAAGVKWCLHFQQLPLLRSEEGRIHQVPSIAWA